MPDMKRCTAQIYCEGELPATLEYFYADRSRPGGLSSECKLCRRARARDQYRGRTERVKVNTEGIEYAWENCKKTAKEVEVKLSPKIQAAVSALYNAGWTEEQIAEQIGAPDEIAKPYIRVAKERVERSGLHVKFKTWRQRQVRKAHREGLTITRDLVALVNGRDPKHIDGKKRCTIGIVCGGELLPATPEYFAVRSAASDGLTSQCKKCRNYLRNKQRRIEIYEEKAVQP